jgi:AhpD family alkylhydroperoxidase
MARITLVEPGSGSVETEAAYEQLRELWGGQVFTDWQPLGRSPEVLVAFARFFHTLQGERGGSITDVRDKELVAIRTSALNRCDYCVGHNTHLGAAAGLTVEEIGAALGDRDAEASLSPRQRVLLRWTDLVVANTAAEDEETYALLREHFDDAEIAELTLLCCLFTGWNRFTRAFHIELEQVEDREGITACLARPAARP